jgi:Icc-related predicted phosphoesterase
LVSAKSLDLIIFAGDIVNGGEPVAFADKFVAILQEIDLPFFWVPGNNDFGRSYHHVNAVFKSLEGQVVMLSSPPKLGGVRGGTKNSNETIRLTGVGGSPESWAGQYAGESMIDKKLIGDSIFVSHVPPPGALTMCKYDIGAPPYARKFSDSPRLHICGHNHYRWGSAYLGQTKILNPGSLALGRYAILDTETLAIEFERFV